MTGDVVKEEFGGVLGLAGGGERDEMGALGKAANKDIDAITTMVDRGETADEVHGDRLPTVGRYGERLEFASLSLVGGIDGLAIRARTDVGFDVQGARASRGNGRYCQRFSGNRGVRQSWRRGVSQELGTETTDGRDAKTASSFDVDVEEMVDEGVVRDSVKVVEFGIGSGEVRVGGVAMDEAMLERLGKLDMRRGSEDFLRGFVIGSAREGISNTIGLVGSMADGEGKLGKKIQPAGLTRGDILFGKGTGDDGVVGANGEVLAIEVMALYFKGIDDSDEFLLIGGIVHLNSDKLLVRECDRVLTGKCFRLRGGIFDSRGVVREMLG
ncbi:hypothetical protein CBR_g51072 [Chara braunii]|uniref:Uncharacterized protein n=1 Tax=Chara braunii TaxID=69332 RepID=A0A388K604_CHABU|nr:hypothetical protein CBR_g51072 [Chara braunii]|eukprot:GBG65477.1 hypothetical protein CBR_g51072 [Chara braunii]